MSQRVEWRNLTTRHIQEIREEAEYLGNDDLVRLADGALARRAKTGPTWQVGARVVWIHYVGHRIAHTPGVVAATGRGGVPPGVLVTFDAPVTIRKKQVTEGIALPDELIAERMPT